MIRKKALGGERIIPPSVRKLDKNRCYLSARPPPLTSIYEARPIQEVSHFFTRASSNWMILRLSDCRVWGDSIRHPDEWAAARRCAERKLNAMNFLAPRKARFFVLFSCTLIQRCVWELKKNFFFYSISSVLTKVHWNSMKGEIFLKFWRVELVFLKLCSVQV